jgi:hypothetical protein
MGREQKHLLDARFLLRLQEALCAPLWWTEEPEGIRNRPRLLLGYRCGIMRFFEVDTSLLEPTVV